MARTVFRSVIALGLGALLGACAVTPDAEQDYPDSAAGRRAQVERMQKLERGGETLFGDISIGGPTRRGEAVEGVGAAVNLFLWRAALETLSLGPLESADPFGGVIITDWFTLDRDPSNQYRVTAYILGRTLRTGNVKVALYVRSVEGGQTLTRRASPTAETRLENVILTKARTIRATQYK